MNLVKRILAIAGVVILAGLYIVTLILAITNSETTQRWFTACIVATVVVPVLIYVYQWIYKLVKRQAEESRNPDRFAQTQPENSISANASAVTTSSDASANVTSEGSEKPC